MQIRIENGLAYVSTKITYQDKEITLLKVIIDTGSSGTLFSLDKRLVQYINAGKLLISLSFACKGRVQKFV